MSSRARRPRSKARVVSVSAVAVGALLSTYAGALRTFSYARAVAPAAATCSAGAVLVSDDTQLQAAIASSGDDSIICVTADITLSSTLLIDDTTITLEGREVGGRDPELSGDYARRIINADFTDNASDDTLTVRDLVLVAGRASGQGGAVLLRGGNRSDALVMAGVEVAGNYSTDDGGGVSATNLSSVHVEASNFHDDTVGLASAGDISGGALKVANTAHTTIRDSYFRDNSSVEWGGAVLLNDAGVVRITGSVFERNVSGTNAGGAIEIDIDDTTLPGSVYITSTLFSQNSSTSGPGGGVRVTDNDDTVTFDTVTFDRNSTGSNSGGGLSISSQSGPVFLTDVTATDNSAGSSGGFLRVSSMTSALTIDGLDSRRNEAVSDGGSVKQTSGSLAVRNSTFVDDSAGVDGGAIYSDGLLRVDVANSQFTGNYARDDAGGLMVRDTPSAYIASSLFRLNSVVLDDGGAILINNADDTISLTDVTLDRNSTGAEGGGVKIVSSDGTAIMDGITATGNSAGTSGGAAYISRPVYSVIENSTFVGNRATQGGGGIYANGVAALYLNFLTASGNYAAEGGALSLDDTVGASIVNSIVAGNTASSSGSDVYVDGTSSLDDSYSLFTSAGSVVGATISGVGSKFGPPKLNSLADNGGPTQTMLPQWDSPAVKAGDPNWTAPPANDQRGAGFPRDAGGRVNMGAIQGASAQPPPPPTYPPSAPRDVTALAGDSLAVVSWAEPASSGSFPITNYQIDDSTGTVSALVQIPSGEPLAATIEDLVNGESYSFRVRALNGAGWGPWSVYSDPVTPTPEAAILITGSRDGRYVRVNGTSTGLDGETLTPRIRFPGPQGYRDGFARPRVSAEGTFTWQRSTNKKTYVYFYIEDGGLRSNRVIIPAWR